MDAPIQVVCSRGFTSGLLLKADAFRVTATLAWRPPMRIYGADNQEIMDVTRLERDGAQLVIRGKIFGAMPLTAKLRPEEARALFKLLDFRTALFLLTLPFRKSG